MEAGAVTWLWWLGFEGFNKVVGTLMRRWLHEMLHELVENGEKSCGLNAPSLVWRWASSVPGDLAWSAIPSVNTYTRERAKQTGDMRKEKTEGNEEKRKKGKRFISKAIISPHFCSYLFSWQNTEFPLHLFRFFFYTVLLSKCSTEHQFVIDCNLILRMACSNVVLPFTLQCAVTISCRIVQSWQGPSVRKLNHMHNCCLTKALWSRKKQFLIKETQISNRHNVHRGGRSAALLRPLTCTTNEKMVPVNSQQTTYLHPYLALVRYSPTNGTDSPITDTLIH